MGLQSLRKAKTEDRQYFWYFMIPSIVRYDNRSFNSQSKVKATLTLYEIAVKEHELMPIVYSTHAVGLSRFPVLMISFSGRNPKEILQACDAELYKAWAMTLSSANKVHSSDWHSKKLRYKTQRSWASTRLEFSTSTTGSLFWKLYMPKMSQTQANVAALLWKIPHHFTSAKWKLEERTSRDLIYILTIGEKFTIPYSY